MKQSLLQFWQRLTHIPVTPPINQQRWLRWIICGGGVFMTLLYMWQLWINWRTTGQSLWLTVEFIRSTLFITLAGWLLLRPGWRAIIPVQRSRGRIINIIAVIIIGLVLSITILDTVLQNLTVEAIVFYGVQILMALNIRWSSIQGYVTQAAMFFITTLILYILARTGSILGVDILLQNYFLSFCILCTSLLINWRAGIVVAIILPLLMALLQLSGFAPGTIDWVQTGVTSMMLLGITCVVALYDTSLQRALATSATRTKELAAAEQAVVAQNKQLQTQSAELATTQAQLYTIIAEQDQRIQSAVTQLRHNSIDLSTLTTPLSEVAPGVIVAPLVGTWNLQRATRFQETLLHEVERQRLRAVIFDLHGVRSPDTTFATMLEYTVRALLLLGCRAILVGIQPETAQILVTMDTQWEQITTAATLAAGVQVALS